jgi:hypothetical protein
VHREFPFSESYYTHARRLPLRGVPELQDWLRISIQKWLNEARVKASALPSAPRKCAPPPVFISPISVTATLAAFAPAWKLADLAAGTVQTIS